MVRKSVMFPMDFKRFVRQGASFPLFVDEWDLSRSPAQLVHSDEIDFAALGAACPTAAPGLAGALLRAEEEASFNDCKLIRLLRTFDPERAENAWAKRAAVGARRSLFDVLFLDFPGADPSSWKAEYEQDLSHRIRSKYEPFRKVYVHPFVATGSGAPADTYELVLQYWFFYSINDSANKHEGTGSTSTWS